MTDDTRPGRDDADVHPCWTSAGAPLDTPTARPAPHGFWTATGDAWRVSWEPTAPHLSGDAEVVGAVVAYLAERVAVAVTPTGPFVPADPAEALAVVGTLATLGYRFLLSGGAPQFPGVPDGAVA